MSFQVGMFMFVNVLSSLMSVISPSLFVFSVCVNGDVVRYFWYFRFMCDFFCIVRNWAPISGVRHKVNTICADVCSSPTLRRLCDF